MKNTNTKPWERPRPAGHKMSCGGLLSMAMLALLALAIPAGAEEQTRKIERSFPVAAGQAPRVEVENVNGPIRVVGYDGAAIQLSATETFRADTADKIAKGQSEVKLDITQEGGTIKLYVDGPFRCRCQGERRGGVNFQREPGYQFRHALELRVPVNTSLFLRAINDGDISVENVGGDYDVENINGGVTLTEVSGSGRAYALNGALKAVFRANPRGASYFGSLNGDVDVFFRPGLSADLRFKTFNGKIYTDFELGPLPAAVPVAKRENGRFVYKSDRFTGARAGNGGPEIKFDAFNGDIRVRQRS